ncbi:flagellar protein FlgN [Klenkia sp. LSe6-5]|uniref:Flagellar protein FlgN n=1 Tax=Klenkia sesuvii TaxID=3103137 RepID=A0ABU8DPB5_9ACTN
MDYQHLSTLLWREQELLDLLLFKAEEKQYLIVSGKNRWLPRIAHEIEVVLEQLRTLEVERAAVSEVIAEALGLAPNPSLRTLAEHAGAPWDDLLVKHHETLLVLVGELRGLSDANRDLIASGLAAIDQALLTVRPDQVRTYSASGRAHAGATRAVGLDGAL